MLAAVMLGRPGCAAAAAGAVVMVVVAAGQLPGGHQPGDVRAVTLRRPNLLSTALKGREGG